MRTGSQLGVYAVGLTAIDGLDGSICGASQKYDFLCNPDVHINCASKLYQKYGWSYWKEAQACGCENNLRIK